MSGMETTGTGRIMRPFSGQRSAAHSPAEEVADEISQAALRQFSLERIMAYGVHHPDAMELRGRVWAGENWQAAATELAETCLSPPEQGLSTATDQTRINRLLRASALLRMSQAMMVDNSDERRGIIERAGRLYGQAAEVSGLRTRQIIETPNGPLVGWLHHCVDSEVVGRAVLIGGIEGWSMDFSEMARDLSDRGIEVLALDGPGQGESRMNHHHYLSKDWVKSYTGVFDFLEQRSPSLPICFIGNSMGGAVGMHLARVEPRIVAFCDNGGSPNPGRDRGTSTIAYKMAAHVGEVTLEESREVWKYVVPVDAANLVQCPLLVVHGGQDPLISDEDAEAMFEGGISDDRHLIIFEDGDHCIYNHADDRNAVIGDWLVHHLRGK